MLAEIRQAISDAVDVIPKLQVNPYMLSNPTPPCAYVVPDPITYDTTYQRGQDEYAFTIVVQVSENSGDIGAQKRLDRFMEPSGPESVKASVEYGEGELIATLGGLVDSVQVDSCDGYRTYITQGRAPVLGTEFHLTVRASGGG